MIAGNGTVADSATALEVIEARETSPLDAYLESTSKTRSRIVEELAELRDTEQRLCDELTKQAAEARTRCANYARAIEALGTKTAKPKTPKPSKLAPRPIKGANDWQISDTKVAEVERRVRELLPDAPNGTVTAAYIANHTESLSPETARRALQVLREREVVRIAGTGKGGGVLFALMPEGSGAD